MKNWLILFFVLLVLLAGIFFILRSGEIEIISDSIKDNNETALDKKYELSLDQKIGQLFIIGIDGLELNDKTEKLLKELHPGGVLLLGKNVKDEKQLKSFIDSLQKISLEDTGLPLFIAVDQEGGVISRIKWAESIAQSKIKNPEDAHNIAGKRGKELKDLGINLNLSPVLDSASSGDFVFQRCFTENAGQLAKAMIEGYKESGILSCIKHFPGYGGISFNPEDKLAFLDKMPEISQFTEAGEAQPEFIMVSNVVYKDFDKETPFPFLNSGISFLKEKIKGDYLVISDDMDQYSFLNNFSLEDSISGPFNAGVDVLIFSGWRINFEEGIEAFKGAFKNGKIDVSRIDESVPKIIELKSRIKNEIQH
jgi:beta-N-acetylhexosaminidase